MRCLLIVMAVTANLAASDMVKVFGLNWSVPTASDWAMENQDGAPVLKLLVARPPEKAPRKPSQFALAETKAFTRVRVEAEVKRMQGSLIIVYAYQDDLHFNYAHLSEDSAKKQIVHNGIFHVYGGDRVRISRNDGPASLPSNQEWYKVMLDYDAASGNVEVTVNGEHNSSLHGVDLSLGAGRVGLGSFFETAQFRNVRVTGE